MTDCPIIKENEKLKAKIKVLEKKLKEATEKCIELLSNSGSKK